MNMFVTCIYCNLNELIFVRTCPMEGCWCQKPPVTPASNQGLRASSAIFPANLSSRQPEGGIVPRSTTHHWPLCHACPRASQAVLTHAPLSCGTEGPRCNPTALCTADWALVTRYPNRPPPVLGREGFFSRRPRIVRTAPVTGDTSSVADVWASAADARAKMAVIFRFHCWWPKLQNTGSDGLCNMSKHVVGGSFGFKAI